MQHLIVWYHVLSSQRAFDPLGQIRSIRVESLGCGNVDDLDIERETGRPEFWQVKASVDATTPATTKWLFEHSSGKPGLLRKFYDSWKKLKAVHALPRLVLMTTKNIAPDDPVLVFRDRQNLVVDAMSTDALQGARATWAGELGITEGELIDFLRHLEFRTGINESDWRSRVQDVAVAAGIRCDDAAIALGIQTVRDWIKDPRQSFTREHLASELKSKGLLLESKRALITVQALDNLDRSHDAEISLDWVAHFEGNEARTRRKLLNDSDAQRLLQELSDVRRKLRDRNKVDLEVDGLMRLPLWFTVGAYLGATAGFTLRARCQGEMWCTDCDYRATPAVLSPASPIAPREGADWCVSVNVSLDITQDVETYCKARYPENTIFHLQLNGGPGPKAIGSAEEARRLALDIRDELRRWRPTLKPQTVHLFLAMPGAAALFLGHAWDRLPSTLTYWDMGQPGEYHVAFLVPN